MTPTLGALLNLHGSDKESFHRYADHYERAFGHLRHMAIAFLEIGVYGGASMRAWADYFTHARVIGLDVNGAPAGTPGLVIQGDATDPRFVAGVIDWQGPFDVVLDDGSHLWRDQRVSFDLLWPAVTPGGVYVIEDLATSRDPKYGPDGPTAVEWLGTLIADVLLDLPSSLGIARIECGPELVAIHKAQEAAS